jgi:hypothetical protein
MMKQMQEQTSIVEMKKRMATQRSEQSMEHLPVKTKIVEATEICKMLKLNIKFRLMQV